MVQSTSKFRLLCVALYILAACGAQSASAMRCSTWLSNLWWSFAPKPADTTRVVILDVDGSLDSSMEAIENLFEGDNSFTLSRISVRQLEAGGLKRQDVLIVPGGRASVIRKALGDRASDEIKNFVLAGGSYIGICAGAYLAAVEPARYGLGLAAVRVTDTKNWMRGSGWVDLAGTSSSATFGPLNMYYANGPLLEAVEGTGLPEIDALATFDSNIYPDDKPELSGRMPGKLAIVQSPHGKGRVLLFSTHPEFTDSMRATFLEAVQSSVAKPE